EIIAKARALRPSAVIGVELDLHCHLTVAMVEEADFVIPCKEYPHIDFIPRAKELFDLCRAKAEGRIRPVAALVDTAMVGFYPTLDPPMSEIVADLKAAEARAPILTAGIAHGFPWGDVAEMGTRVLVYADGDAEAASREAMAFARRLYGLRETLLPRLPEIADSLEKARGLNGRIVLGDFADNPGGGAPGDSTFFLRAMLERNLSEAAVGCIYDPMAAAICAEAGVGAKLAIRLGGKSGPASGDPLDLTVEVMAVEENHSQGVFGGRQPLGRSVWLKSGGIDIVVSSVRTQVFEKDAFTGLGMALDDKRLVVVKSSNHFQAGFRPGADHIWAVASPGALGLDFAAMPYQRRKGDYFPRVRDPWADRGEPSPRIYTR
ncbi:MAG: MlrC C-terminal domain-containing protein, partial [Caulobacteraceae bacterium]